MSSLGHIFTYNNFEIHFKFYKISTFYKCHL